MTDENIQKYGEIQYIKGRLDELFKSFPLLTNLTESRSVDSRIEKYLDKLKSLDEISYHLYLVEIYSRKKSKEREDKHIKQLLDDILIHITDEQIKDRIITQINSY